MSAYRRILSENGIIQNMPRKGNCLDLAIKTEYFYGREFNCREEIVDVIRNYVDYHNHQWIQLKLKGLSPIQYRCQPLSK
ncbi:IS3 family transposase [Haemophilus haemolyticus]|uniref:IS3 family transposase n=1 Tax=Haemophilus haemolyticus TaxID=726 RepID=UPI000E57D7B6|nr:IS3 family transposase [Haemophilus haemolyticus]